MPTSGNLEMHGKGNFYDPRLDDATKYPVAARTRHRGNKRDTEDRITPKLGALHFYQLSCRSRNRPPVRSTGRRRHGEIALSTARRDAASCHVRPSFTEPAGICTRPKEIGIDDFFRRVGRRTVAIDPHRCANCGICRKNHRSGFYHDGRFAT